MKLNLDKGLAGFMFYVGSAFTIFFDQFHRQPDSIHASQKTLLDWQVGDLSEINGLKIVPDESVPDGRIEAQ